MTPASLRSPVLETERLRLRAHRPEDLDARAAITADRHVMRHIGGLPQSREENWARILRYAGHWALFGHGLFAIEERAGGRLAGEAGLADFGRGLGADFDDAPEAAWVLAGWAEGRGYATEAMRAILDWRERSFGPARTVCLIAPENAGSLRVAAKLGFTRFAERPYHDRPCLLLERSPPVRAHEDD